MTAPAAHFEITETTHPDCPVCIDFANTAAIYASATGSTGGTYGTEKALVNPVPDFVAHSATVRRIPEGKVIIMHDPRHAVVDELIEKLTPLVTRIEDRFPHTVPESYYRSLTEAVSALLKSARYALIKES